METNAPFIWIDGVAPATPSLVFQNPLHVVRAQTVADVSATLGALDLAIAEGYYIAGYFSYEAVPTLARLSDVVARAPATLPASDPSSANHESPVLWFGVFKEPLPPGRELIRPPGDGNDREYSLRPGDVDEDREREEFQAAVREIRARIAEGEVYQVNLTRTREYEFSGDPFALYRLLRRLQPVSHRAYLRHDDRAILSCSPELFLRSRTSFNGGALLEARPIKGTIARSTQQGADLERARELSQDVKNRAENAMIVDLLRNDLGIHARAGSVQVPEIFQVETLPTLHQMYSRIHANIDEQKRIAFFREVFPSLFPCGSITGAPKRAARLFIKMLENTTRGVYTGSIGWMGPEGGAFSVAIRTLQIDGLSQAEAGGAGKDGGATPARARYGSGCGIVWDSVPEEEWREYQLKGSFLLPALDDFYIFTTLRYEGGRVLFVRDHLRRLIGGARRYSFPWSRARLRASLRAALKDLGAATKIDARLRIRIALDRTGSFQVDVSVLTEAFARGMSARVRVLCSPHKIFAGDPFRRLKTSRRELYNREFARVRAAGFDDVLFLNEADEVVESATSNLLVFTESGRWVTPAVDTGALPGIYIKNLLRRGNHIESVRLSIEDLRAARRIFVCNAVRGLRPVELVEDAAPGETETEEIQYPAG